MNESIEYRGFLITKTKNGFRICRCDDIGKHTHLKNIRACYSIINNVVSGKIPKRCGNYYLESHARLSEDNDYIKKIHLLISVRSNKTHQNYYNPHKKKF